jgi:hypothetical protein
MGLDVWPEDRASFAGVFRRSSREGTPAPDSWRQWLRSLFPQYVKHDFGQRHADFWDWLWAMQEADSPDPFIGVWPRGGAKSTSVELGTTALGVRNRRKYAVYVRETQDQADNSVSNIGSLLSSPSIERHYPEHADRMVGKFGNSLGWRRNRLRTSGGFTIDALGLDSASRGAKIDEQRPDLIVFDDIDDKHDSPAVTARKIATITTSIIPAGASNVAFIGIQNLIIADGFFTRMTNGKADYLARRIVSGPFKAIDGLVTEKREDPKGGVRNIIVGGTATWAGQDIKACQKQIDDMGLSAFLKEAQHEVTTRAEGIVLKNFSLELVEDLEDDECIALVAMGRAFGGIDFGAWRFGYVLRAVDREGRPHQIAEYFSQRDESLEDRARAIHAINTYYGVPASLNTWGDAANPTDIQELNLAFKRIGSPYRVVPVAMENKIRKASVDRFNDLHDRKALFYRRSVHRHVYTLLQQQWEALGYEGEAPDTRVWMLGWNASSGGVETEGSRLLWEVENWTYPVPKEGQAQDQDPDDHTADGADLIAADRYGVMSWWKAAKQPTDEPKTMQEARARSREQQKTDKRGDEVLDRAAKTHEKRQRQLEKLVRKMRKAG